MELRDYIEEGTRKASSQKALAEYLNVYASNIRDVNRGMRGLPNDTCIKLARLINVDPLEVIAASELVTEKKPEKRAFWLPFVEHAKAACALLAVMTVISGTAQEARAAQAESGYNNPCLHTAGVTGSSPVPPTKNYSEAI
ncbi:MAG: helix-turn-helix transcriptional regulator [Zoogloeaceae bacterium]|nr:helix-turn-helix transcriptional regulator [Zoogloeaceae bacterium]